jgi:hypothetical protein
MSRLQRLIVKRPEQRQDDRAYDGIQDLRQVLMAGDGNFQPLYVNRDRCSESTFRSGLLAVKDTSKRYMTGDEPGVYPLQHRGRPMIGTSR